MENSTSVPSNSSKDMLLGYHYALWQQAKQLAKDKIEIQKGKTQPSQPATPLAEHEAMRHILTQEEIVNTVQGTKTSSTQKGKASLETSTRLSYRSTSKGTSYQKPPKQH
jgi:hypothetical protein